MKSIRMLDCTLRDGGCVNDFNFGSLYMHLILEGVESAGIEIVELGYIDEKKGSSAERTQYINEQVIKSVLLTKKQIGTTYVAMCDYGKFDFNNLHQCTPDSIDGIRLAFHKKDRMQAIECGKVILSKGYKLFIQPMTVMRYSDMELIDFIERVNAELPEAEAFYIVDSFGEMRINDLNRIMNIVDHNLNSDISVGFHAHNNLQLAYSNAVSLLGFSTNRNLIFDSSILGMGKGAGNMNTELFAEHLNLFENKNYNISALLETIDRAMNQLRQKYFWGYSVEYYLSSKNHCTPSYASHFYKKHMLSIDQVAELLGKIKEEKKISFDKVYADELYYEYNSSHYDDSSDIDNLEAIVGGKRVLLIAPGNSVRIYQKDIEDFIKNNRDVITIGVNNVPVVNVDYMFASKSNVYEMIGKKENLICTSNVSSGGGHLAVVNYSRWTEDSGIKSDNALFIIGNTLKAVHAKEIILAGFDGFSLDVDSNYYDEKLKRPIDKEQVVRRNSNMKRIIHNLKNDVAVSFLTPSMYESRQEDM